MFSKLNDLTLRVAAAAHSGVARKRSRGLETVEWVLVGVAVVIIAFGAYSFLGERMNLWIRDLATDIE